MPANLRDLAAALASPADRVAPPVLRQGVITATAAGPPATVSVSIGGEPAIPGVRYATSIGAPAVGQTVWLLVSDTDLFVAFRLA